MAHDASKYTELLGPSLDIVWSLDIVRDDWLKSQECSLTYEENKMKVYEYLVITKPDENGKFEIADPLGPRQVVAEDEASARLIAVHKEGINPKEVDILVRPFC